MSSPLETMKSAYATLGVAPDAWFSRVAVEALGGACDPAEFLSVVGARNLRLAIEQVGRVLGVARSLVAEYGRNVLLQGVTVQHTDFQGLMDALGLELTYMEVER